MPRKCKDTQTELGQVLSGDRRRDSHQWRAQVRMGKPVQMPLPREHHRERLDIDDDLRPAERHQ